MLAGLSPVLAAEEPLDKVVNGSLMVTRVGGVGTGLVVGPPVATLRETYSSYVSMTSSCAEHVGGKDCGPSCLLVSLVTLPASIVVGTGKGVYYGCKNAFTHGFNEPFSPASFSISKDYEGK